MVVVSQKRCGSHSPARRVECFCAKMVKLGSCDTDCISHKAKNVYLQGLYRKGLLTPALDQQRRGLSRYLDSGLCEEPEGTGQKVGGQRVGNDQKI